MTFAEELIAYILRICDDLQEWDRAYFDVTERGGLRIFDSGKTPMFKRREDGRDVIKCACDKKVHRFGSQRYSRVYIARMANNVRIELQHEDHIPKLNIDLGYEPFNMLTLSIHINQTVNDSNTELEKLAEALYEGCSSDTRYSVKSNLTIYARLYVFWQTLDRLAEKMNETEAELFSRLYEEESLNSTITQTGLDI